MVLVNVELQEDEQALIGWCRKCGSPGYIGIDKYLDPSSIASFTSKCGHCHTDKMFSTEHDY